MFGLLVEGWLMFAVSGCVESVRIY